MQHELARQHGRMQDANDQDLPVRGHSVDDGMLADEVAKVGWDLMQGFEVHDCKGPLGDATRRPTPDAELPALSAGVVGKWDECRGCVVPVAGGLIGRPIR